MKDYGGLLRHTFSCHDGIDPASSALILLKLHSIQAVTRTTYPVILYAAFNR
jgi:hypothetical protein